MTDADYMRMALKEAWKSAGHTRPNPPVGAIVVSPSGEIVGRGRHRRCGTDHAEAAALKNAGSAKGCTVYCTLEPCSKPGRVGACTDALIAAGVARVVWAAVDPNPKNRGKAARVLAKAGIKGELLKSAPDVTAEARELIAPFSKHVTTGLPYVTVKIALSLDGRISDERGNARWISSSASRRRTGKLRERVDCVLVGGQTVRADNPSLLCHTKRNNDLWRAVVTASGDLPPTAQIFTDDARDRTLAYVKVVKGPGGPVSSRPYPGVVGFSSLREILADLGRRGFMHVLCEGGMELARSLAAEGLVDEWLTVLAPIVIGHGKMSEAKRLAGEDAFITYRCS